MLLPTQQQLQQSKTTEQAKDALRTVNIQKAALQARQDLAKAQADFASSMASFKEKWAKEEESHSQRVKEMEGEVKILEERKRLALIPIKVYEQQGIQLMKEAQLYLVEVSNKERVTDELRELLEDKLDDVGDREQRVRTKELKLSLKEKGIEEQTLQVTEGIKNLNNKTQEFFLYKEKTEKDLNTRLTENILLERSLEAHNDTLKQKEEELRIWAIQVKDREDTLAREERRRDL